MKKLIAAAMMLVGCAADGDALPTFTFGAGPEMPAEKVEIIEAAVAQLNDELGFEAVSFTAGDYFTRGQFVDEPAQPGYFAWTNHYNGNYNGAVLIGKLGLKEANREADVYTTMHEMLHCLGIRHVEDREALMYKDRVVGSAKTISDEARESVIEYLERTSK